MKKCPYCAEEIQDEAIFCRYCHHDLNPSYSEKDKPSNQNTFDSKKPNRVTSTQIAVALTVLAAIGSFLKYKNAPIELIGSLTIGSIVNYLFWWVVISFFRRELPRRIMLTIGAIIGLGVLLCLLFFGASILTLAPDPTATFTPTRRSTIVPIVSPVMPTKNNCIKASEVTADLQGKNICVYGNIIRVKVISSTSINNYGSVSLYFNTQSGFFLVSDGPRYSSVNTGDCVMANGRVELSFEHIPFIKIDQLFQCEK